MKVRRLPVIDLYVEDGEGVVMVGDQVIALSEAATTALLAVGAGWTDLDAIAGALVSEYGTPPDAEGLVTATLHILQPLADHEIVELSGDCDASEGAAASL